MQNSAPLRTTAMVAAYLLMSSGAYAYCITGSVDDVIKRSEAIFIGIPVREQSFPNNPTSANDLVTTFRVVDMLKGDQADEIDIWTNTHQAEGISFRLREQILVAASMWEGQLQTSYCHLGKHSLGDLRTALRKAN